MFLQRGRSILHSRMLLLVLSLAAIGVILAAAALPASAQVSKGDRAFGEYLSSECVTCHQSSGRFEGIPPIVGWPEESFVAIMNEYRHKKRPNAVMQTIAGRLSDEELAALAAFFGSLTAKPR
jgi:cytochrome c553